MQTPLNERKDVKVMNQYTLFGAEQNPRAVTALDKPTRAVAAVNEDYY
jgi:hypothetical protein